MQRNGRTAFATAVLIMALAAPVSANHGESQQVNPDLAGWMVGEFTLADQRGVRFTQERLKGQWTFLLLGGTRCDETCSAALSALSAMVRRIAGTKAVETTQVLFVSLDPEHDSPEKLRRYLRPFDPRFIGLGGSRENLVRLAEDLSPPGTDGKPGCLLLIGPDRSVRGEFLPPYDVLLLTAKYLKMRAGG